MPPSYPIVSRSSACPKGTSTPMVEPGNGIECTRDPSMSALRVSIGPYSLSYRDLEPGQHWTG